MPLKAVEQSQIVRTEKVPAMEPPEHPLPNDVYLNYLERVEGTKRNSSSTITNQRMAYRAFLKENLC